MGTDQKINKITSRPIHIRILKTIMNFQKNHYKQNVFIQEQQEKEVSALFSKLNIKIKNMLLKAIIISLMTKTFKREIKNYRIYNY